MVLGFGKTCVYVSRLGFLNYFAIDADHVFAVCCLCMPATREAKWGASAREEGTKVFIKS